MPKRSHSASRDKGGEYKKLKRQLLRMQAHSDRLVRSESLSSSDKSSESTGVLQCSYSCNEATCGSIVSKCLLTESCTCDVQIRTCSKDCFNCLGHLYSDCCSCVEYSVACNEAICGSIVSKCLLIKSCSCDLATKPCARECFNCLGILYHECCTCVDMCPKSEEDLGSLTKKSVVEDFQEAVPQLFQALTEFPDQLGQWTALEVPMDINIKTNQDDASKPKFLSINCTVVFWSQCMSWKKCRNGCLSMGATSYRWFHDGCCECVGQSCINYGLDENRCPQCPKNGTVTTVIVNENELDYGEEEDMFDYEEEDI